MKYLRQFCIILFVSFLCEILYMVLPIPVPASVCGLLLMFLALCTGILKPEQIGETADFLIEIMPVMFIPAAAGLLDSWPSLQPVWLPVVLAAGIAAGTKAGVRLLWELSSDKFLYPTELGGRPQTEALAVLAIASVLAERKAEVGVTP